MMTTKKITNLYWDELVWGHIDAYHNNATLEELTERVSSAEVCAASTFINDENHDGDICEFICDKLIEHLSEINIFLSKEFDYFDNKLVFLLNVPKNINTMKLYDDGHVGNPNKFLLVIGRNQWGEIEMITSYPI